MRAAFMARRMTGSGTSFTILVTLALLAVRAFAGQATLAWDPSTDPAVTGYSVHYGLASRSYTTKLDVGKQSTYTVVNLQEGKTYYYAVSARDAAGNQSAFSNEASSTVPYAAPSATLGANVTSGLAPLAVAFTSTVTGTVSSYSWNFGDGTGSTVQNPTHSYAAGGPYSVSLTVSGPGGSKTVSKANYITASAPPPVANFTSTISGLAVSFSSTSTGSISAYSWNFGNGATSTFQNPSYAYATPGTYTVSLTVTGPGGSSRTSGTVTVAAAATAPTPNQSPEGSIVAPSGSLTVESGTTINFQGIGSDPDGNAPLTYSWDFGGAAETSVQQNPKVQFNTPGGSYAVRLTVRDAKGLADPTPASLSVTVTAPRPAPAAPPALGSATTIVSAVLPASRAVQVGTTLTVYATMINAGPAVGTGCSIGLSSSIPATLGYQTTNSDTNMLTGNANTPVDIEPGAAQSFVISLTPAAVLNPTDVQLRFSCANAAPAGILTGINTLLLSASNTATPDVIALAATTTRDGIANIPGAFGTGAFAVASANVGSGDTITATADTGSAVLPVHLTLCQTDSGTGGCLQPPASSVSTTIVSGATPTFAVFVRGTGTTIPLDPAGNRVYVRFRDSSNTVRGASSVAVQTR